MKPGTLKTVAIMLCVTLWLAASSWAQVNSGSNGSDGALDLSAYAGQNTNIVINMADHPDGIYQYTSVNIPAGVTVSFFPNANNTPVVWLVQSNCLINGTVDLSGQSATDAIGRLGGPGGFQGGNGGNFPSMGMGPGGGRAGGYSPFASYGTLGSDAGVQPGDIYGNQFIVPLIGGSGGGGGSTYGPPGVCGGGGGGGAILIAASSEIQVNGAIFSRGGNGNYIWSNGIGGGGGSGGAVRLVASRLIGTGSIDCAGGLGGRPDIAMWRAGLGRIRFDVFELSFGGNVNGAFTSGYQPIIIPAPGQLAQLAITSLAGIAVPSNTVSTLLNPAVVIPGQQANPIPVVVQCSNIPLNTTITVQVNPASGATVTTVGMNNFGTQASSTATINVDMPRGGGVIYAKALAPIGIASADNGQKYQSYAKTGLTVGGERFAKIELTVTPGGRQKVVFLTASGKRYPL